MVYQQFYDLYITPGTRSMEGKYTIENRVDWLPVIECIANKSNISGRSSRVQTKARNCEAYGVSL